MHLLDQNALLLFWNRYLRCLPKRISTSVSWQPGYLCFKQRNVKTRGFASLPFDRFAVFKLTWWCIISGGSFKYLIGGFSIWLNTLRIWLMWHKSRLDNLTKSAFRKYTKWHFVKRRIERSKEHASIEFTIVGQSVGSYFGARRDALIREFVGRNRHN